MKCHPTGWKCDEYRFQRVWWSDDWWPLIDRSIDEITCHCILYQKSKSKLRIGSVWSHFCLVKKWYLRTCDFIFVENKNGCCRRRKENRVTLSKNSLADRWSKGGKEDEMCFQMTSVLKCVKKEEEDVCFLCVSCMSIRPRRRRWFLEIKAKYIQTFPAWKYGKVSDAAFTISPTYKHRHTWSLKNLKS